MLSMIALAAALSSAPFAIADTPAIGTNTHKPVSAKALQGDFARSLTIEIEVVSASSLVLDYGSLTGGQWQQPPMAGSVIEPGDSMTYVNGVENPFDALGGMMMLSLPSGATIAIAFEWAFGGSVACTANGENLQTVAVTNELVNTMGNAPTCLVTITDQGRE
ncbi:hypothetical protein [Maricaulis sp.]|uniref:hypothetical protein n=1 Tax=Maricaulis sp. TaxID=1486257 RepID=UPI0025B85F60|nr:hypothetical protein [Maricaulis sp.]